MAGRVSRWNGRRVRRSALMEINRTLNGDMYWDVRPGEEQGFIALSIRSHKGKWTSRIMPVEQASKIAEALNDEVWNDSMRGELPEGVVSDG